MGWKPNPNAKGLNAPIAEVLKTYENDQSKLERIAFRDEKRKVPITMVPYDPMWPTYYLELHAKILAALGTTTALHIAHYGSTSVPGIHAKPVIDIDLVVRDVEDEQSYVPALEAAGFQFLSRQPDWMANRFFVGYEPISCNLHVYGKQCPEVEKHRIFRDYLIGCDQDRDLYGQTKIKAAEVAVKEGMDIWGYNQQKQEVILQILHRAFASIGYLPNNDDECTA